MACLICGRDCEHGRIGSGLTITKVDKETSMFTLTKDLDMNEDQTKAVPAGTGRYVLGVRGSQIPDDLAVKLGLKEDPNKDAKKEQDGPFKRYGLSSSNEGLEGRNVRMVDGYPVLKETALEGETSQAEEAEVLKEDEATSVEPKEVTKSETQDKAVKAPEKK